MIKQMEKTVEELRPHFESVDWSNPKVYGNWLSQAYYIAKRSTSFLGLTLFHSDNYPEFQKRCTEHIAEETGHEKLIMNDLKHLGIALQNEHPTTSAIYQTQYYRIVAESPLSFLGYVFFLELLAPAYGSYVMSLVSNKKSLSFLKVHSSADEDHLESAKIAWKNLSDSQKEMAMSNFQMSAESYKRLLEYLAECSAKVQQVA